MRTLQNGLVASIKKLLFGLYICDFTLLNRTNKWIRRDIISQRICYVKSLDSKYFCRIPLLACLLLPGEVLIIQSSELNETNQLIH